MSALSVSAAFALVALFQIPADPTLGSTTPSLAPVAASVGVAPDTVTVGDPFRALVRVEVPPGSTVEFPEFNILEPIEAVDTLRVARDSSGAWTATYPLVAWTTGDSLVAAMSFRVRAGDGTWEDYRVRLPLPVVRSVLPADSTLHLPRPAKAVIPIAPTGPVQRGWYLPAALLLALLIGILWLALRTRRAPLAVPDPRATALSLLDEIERSGLLERGELLEYHVQTSRVLREYLATREGWGEDLTSAELLLSSRGAGMDEASAVGLERLLRRADLVKFSGGTVGTRATSHAEFGAGVRAWISAWPPPAISASRSEAA